MSYLELFTLILLCGHFTKDWVSNRLNLDQIFPDESIILIGPIVVLNRLEQVIDYCF